MQLAFEDHLLLLLMKMRLGVFNRDLAVRFEIHRSRVSKVFCNWVPILSNVLNSLFVWPGRGTKGTNLPAAFKKKWKDVVAIIGCKEVFIERPKNLTARTQTWSNFKQNNTAKYLISITPSGNVSVDSGFFDKISMGDNILADRGFTFKEELASLGATLKFPHFTKEKSQLSGKEVDTSRQLSSVRIHVEMVIGQVKNIHMLRNIVPLTQMDLLDNIMVIVCAIINLN